MLAAGRRVAAAWDWLESLASRRLGVVILVIAALGAYALRSIAWPVAIGSDLDDYLRDYVELVQTDPVLPSIMLGKTPLTPLVDGLLLDVAGGALAAPVLALLYAASVLAWSATARLFSSGAAVAVALVLLVFPSYGGLFHVVSSE